MPPTLWPGLSLYGWMAKIVKVQPKKKILFLKFHDSMQGFSLDEVKESMKPIS